MTFDGDYAQRRKANEELFTKVDTHHTRTTTAVNTSISTKVTHLGVPARVITILTREAVNLTMLIQLLLS